MTARGLGRFDGDVHYYDYTSDTLRRDPDRIDSYIVAEAFVYDRDVDEPNAVEKVAITVIVTGQELDIEKVSRDEAIRRGEEVRAQAIVAHRGHLPPGHRAVVYGLQGQVIETD